MGGRGARAPQDLTAAPSVERCALHSDHVRLLHPPSERREERQPASGRAASPSSVTAERADPEMRSTAAGAAARGSTRASRRRVRSSGHPRPSSPARRTHGTPRSPAATAAHGKTSGRRRPPGERRQARCARSTRAGAATWPGCSPPPARSASIRLLRPAFTVRVRRRRPVRRRLRTRAAVSIPSTSTTAPASPTRRGSIRRKEAERRRVSAAARGSTLVVARAQGLRRVLHDQERPHVRPAPGAVVPERTRRRDPPVRAPSPATRRHARARAPGHARHVRVQSRRAHVAEREARARRLASAG